MGQTSARETRHSRIATPIDSRSAPSWRISGRWTQQRGSSSLLGSLWHHLGNPLAIFVLGSRLVLVVPGDQATSCRSGKADITVRERLCSDTVHSFVHVLANKNAERRWRHPAAAPCFLCLAPFALKRGKLG